MRFARLFCAFLLISLPSLRGQESISDVLVDPDINLSDAVGRAKAVERIANIESQKRLRARARANQEGIPIRRELPSGLVQEIADYDGDKPLYFSTHNTNAAISTGAKLLQNSPYNLTASAVTIGLWDGGSARSTHQEFGSRMIVKDGAAAADHATHVGGTLIASGVVANARGMATQANVFSYDWNSDVAEMTNLGATAPNQSDKIYLSNHSYGYVAGWNYVNDGTRVWEWNGNGTSNASIESEFGMYGAKAREGDILAYNAPYYLIFRSAGNERTDNPSTGQSVSLSVGGAAVAYDPALHPAGDGSYRGGFDTISFNAVGKNILSIGSTADAVTSGNRDASKANVSSFSSWGPTDDGRIKPDLVANGEGLYSPLSGSNTSYGTYSGTSMASPNATGSAALLVQLYGDLFPGEAMRASTLKGLLIHTADDRGNAGPDYKYGWGLINAKTAADLINDHYSFPQKKRLNENQLTTSITTRTHEFIWDGVTPISASLCWTDPAGSSTTISESRTSRLVNNLNLKIIAPNGTEFFPYVMPFVGTWSQESMNLPATTGINNTDNVEQVRISAPPTTGTYQAIVSYSGSLTNGAQNYSLILTGASTELPPITLTNVTPNTGLSGETVNIDLTGTSLTTATTVKLTRNGKANIVASGHQMIGDMLRCSLNLSGASAGTWNVVVSNSITDTATLSNAFTVLDTIWSENFDSGDNGWSSVALTGSNTWNLVTSTSHSPNSSYFAAGPSSVSTTALVSPAIPIPSGASNLQLEFWHQYSFQSFPSISDGGLLEYRIDNGSWVDITSGGNSFASGGYNQTISSNSNAYKNRSAWSGTSSPFQKTIIDLNTSENYAGKNLQLRWIVATNNGTSSTGWYIDSISLTGTAPPANQTPTITENASSDSTETVTDPDNTAYEIIRTIASNLSVLANDDAGESSLTYSWSATGNAPATFSTNNSNAAKNTTITFTASGDYEVTVTITDSQGLNTSSMANLRVLQTPSELNINPPNAVISVGATTDFDAEIIDQFGATINPPPSTVGWSCNGGGSIDEYGVFSATNAGGPYQITAQIGDLSDSADVTVTRATASIELSSLSQTYDGTPKSITATTTPSGLPVIITYDGSASAPTNAGSYAIAATIDDANYEGSASDSLIITPNNSWNAWVAAHFTAEQQSSGLALENADPDGDGMANLAEYALGSNPHAFTPMPTAQVDSTWLTLTFTRPQNLPDVVYAGESSSDLLEWSPVDIEVISSGETESVRARIPISTVDSAKRMMRLRFTRP